LEKRLKSSERKHALGETLKKKKKANVRAPLSSKKRNVGKEEGKTER